MRGPDPGPLPSCGPLPSLGPLLRGRLPAQPVVGGPTAWLDGRFVLVSRLAWDSVDGYDSRHVGTGTYPEPADVDLGDRIGRAGWLVVGVPEAEVVVHPVERQGILDVRGQESRGEGLAPVCPRPLPRTRPDADGAGPPGSMTLCERTCACCMTSRPWCWSGARARGCGR